MERPRVRKRELHIFRTFSESTTASNYLNHPRIIYLCEIYGCLLRLEWNSWQTQDKSSGRRWRCLKAVKMPKDPNTHSITVTHHGVGYSPVLRGGGLPKRSRTTSGKSNVQHIGRYRFCQGAEYMIFPIRFRLSQLPIRQCLIIKEGSSVLISGQRCACNSSASEQDNICKKVPKQATANTTLPGLHWFQGLSLHSWSCLQSASGSCFFRISVEISEKLSGLRSCN